MKYYKTNKNKIAGTSFSEINKRAKQIFGPIKTRTKRQPYIRSKYFHRDKVFFNLFWLHIYEKRESDRTRRLRFFDCALDLIRNTVLNPSTKENPNKRNELLHRFTGITCENEIFHVQIKEDKRTNKKYLISIFPER